MRITIALRLACVALCLSTGWVEAQTPVSAGLSVVPTNGALRGKSTNFFRANASLLRNAISSPGTNVTEATHDATYGRGGWRTVPTFADLAAISTNRLEAGMVAWVTGERRAYVLNGTLDHWSELVPGRVDVRTWGARGDGATDDTAAFQDAIDAITGNTFGDGLKPSLFVPGGHYLVSGLTVSGPIKMCGEAIEANSVAVSDYPLNGSVIVSSITDGSSVIRVVATEGGDGNSYLQGIELCDLAIDCTGQDGHGIEFIGNSNMTDVRLARVRIRNPGADGVRVGDGTLSGSPRFGYLEWNDVSVIRPGKDGFGVYQETFYDVGALFSKLYVNGAGRSSFRFWNVGGFIFDACVENNSGRLESGHGFDFLNVHGATFRNCVTEGNGRSDEAGNSYAPAHAALGMWAAGVQNSLFENCIFTASTGYPGTNGAGVIEFLRSPATNGFAAREPVNNSFVMCRVNSFSPATLPPNGNRSSGGSMGAGSYRYRVTTLYHGGWETPLSASGELHIVTTTTNDLVNLTSIPLAPTLGASVPTARRVYRTKKNGADFFLATTLGDNTTTAWTDTLADGVLGAQAEPRWLVKMDSYADLNEFDQTRFDVTPMISDAGSWNHWSRMYIATVDPDLQPWIGRGTFGVGPSSTVQGSQLWIGSDNQGGRSGSWLSANLEHGASVLVPSFSSARFIEPVALIQGTAGEVTNRVEIGSAAGAFFATHIDFYTASSVNARSTNGIRHITISPSGPFFNTGPIVSNGIAYRVAEADGTPHNVLSMDANKVVGVGDGTSRINVYPGTSGLYLGTLGASSPIYVQRTGFAVATNTVIGSQRVGWVGSYWTGAAEGFVDGGIRLNVNTTGPTYDLRADLGGVDRLLLDSSGVLKLTGGNLQAPGVVATNGVYLGTSSVRITTATLGGSNAVVVVWPNNTTNVLALQP